MSLCQRWRIITLMAFAAASGLGCSALQPRVAQVLPKMVASPSGQLAPLRSAALFYRRTAPASRGIVETASYVREENAPIEVQLLAIRFPNPSGRRDTALAELVVLDPQAKDNSTKKGWPVRLGGWLRDSMPGVAWGDGVKEAKALTLSVHEMQQVLASCERTDEVQLLSNHSEHNGHAKTGAVETQLFVDINGKTELQPGGRSDALDALIRRVRNQGQLISCLVGSEAELAELAGATDSSAMAGGRKDNILVRLPPVASAEPTSSMPGFRP